MNAYYLGRYFVPIVTRYIFGNKPHYSIDRYLWLRYSSNPGSRSLLDHVFYALNFKFRISSSSYLRLVTFSGRYMKKLIHIVNL